MSRIFIIIFYVLAMLAQSVFGQQSDNSLQITKTTQLDEFTGSLGECDFGARVDNLITHLIKNPDSTGYVVLYRGANVLPAEYESGRKQARLEWDFRRQFTFRNISDKRINFINGGFLERDLVEIWIAPNGELPPKLRQTIPKPTLPVEKTFLYDFRQVLAADYDSEPYEFLLPKVKAEIDKENKELGVENQSFTKQEIEEIKFYWVNESFGDVLRNQTESRGVIIFYADDLRLDIKKITRRIEEGKKRIAREAKISPDRMKVVYGGYRNGIGVEFWFVSKNGTEPQSSPEERKKEDNGN